MKFRNMVNVLVEILSNFRHLLDRNILMPLVVNVGNFIHQIRTTIGEVIIIRLSLC